MLSLCCQVTDVDTLILVLPGESGGHMLSLCCQVTYVDTLILVLSGDGFGHFNPCAVR
jgi:hypothetical protein